MLTAGEAIQREMTTELDRAGHVDHDVDAVRLGDRAEILRDRCNALADRLIQRRRSFGGHRVVDAGVDERFERLVRVAHRDRGQFHTRDAVDDLIDQPAAHEPASGHRNPYWIALGRSLGQQFVDAHDHDAKFPTDSKSGQLASFSEMTVTGSSHSMPNAGSFHRNPSSPAGA